MIDKYIIYMLQSYLMVWKGSYLIYFISFVNSFIKI